MFLCILTKQAHNSSLHNALRAVCAVLRAVCALCAAKKNKRTFVRLFFTVAV